MHRTDCTTEKGAYAYALALLAGREYSYYALHTRLVEKGAALDIADAVMHALQSQGLQSDARFMQSLVRIRISQGKGPAILQREAREHRVAPDVLQAAMAEESPDWVALAAAVIQKRFGKLPETWKEKAHHYRFLAMRGFENEQIAEVIREA